MRVIEGLRYHLKDSSHVLPGHTLERDQPDVSSCFLLRTGKSSSSVKEQGAPRFYATHLVVGRKRMRKRAWELIYTEMLSQPG